VSDPAPKFESRKATKARLMAEGRWQAFKDRRDVLRRDNTPREAHIKAVLEFQPKDGTKVVANLESPVYKAARLPRKRKVNWKKDVEWVYQHLDREKVSIAPSHGALILHQQARLNPKWFLDTFIQRMIPTKATLEDEGKRGESGENVQELIQGLLDGNEHAEPIKEVAAT
jgi:hypothetical protein